ncbi:MAG: pilus assembly protein [Chloroflexi bacterium]|nr:pilus assembly protein [Chloroflexota bacterium]
MKPQPCRPKGNEKAQSLVELSLGMVIFLILLAGIVDLGRAIFTQFAMQDAAEEGIVYGTSFPTDCNQIHQRVEYNLANREFAGGMTILTTIEANNGSFIDCSSIPFAQVYAGKELRVVVTKTFPISMPFIGIFIGQTIPLSATARGIILRPQPPEPAP